MAKRNYFCFFVFPDFPRNGCVCRRKKRMPISKYKIIRGFGVYFAARFEPCNRIYRIKQSFGENILFRFGFELSFAGKKQRRVLSFEIYYFNIGVFLQFFIKHFRKICNAAAIRINGRNYRNFRTHGANVTFFLLYKRLCRWEFYE